MDSTLGRSKPTSKGIRLTGFGNPRLLAYLLPCLLAVIVTQMWFHGDSFVAGGDVGPFLRDSNKAELGSIWGHDTTGAGSPTYQVVRAPEVAVIGAARFFGLSEAFAQRFFYSLISIAVVAAVTYLAFGFTTKAYAAGAAGLIALFNPYVMQQLANPLGLWIIVLIGLVSGLIVRVAKGHNLSSVLLVMTSLLASYLALNPPLLALLIVWTFVMVALGTVIGGEGGSRRSLMFVLRAAPWCLFVNLWWVLPFLATLSSGGTGQDVSAVTDVEAWSWTHVRNSIPNVLSLNTSWGWDEPRYFPYAADLNRAPFGLFRFALPAAAFASIFIAQRSRRRVVAYFSVVAIGLVFLSKGLHEPFRGVNLFLYEHIPGMWLLREPASKLGAVLVVVYAILICLALGGAAEAFQSQSRRIKVMAALVPALLVWALIYPRPLWTGEVIPDKRPGLPSEHVNVPDEWRQVAAGINASGNRGKVLILPLNDYYQIPTKWGYYGSDVVPSRLLGRPTVQLRPGGYFAELPAFEQIIKTVQGDLLSGDEDEIARYLQSLGVAHVVLRRDIDLSFPKREFADPTRINFALKHVPGLELVDRSSVAFVYEVATPDGLINAYGSLVGAPSPDPMDLPGVIEHQPPDSVVTTDEAARLGTVGRISSGSDPSTRFQSNTAEYSIDSERSSTALLRVSAKTTSRAGVNISDAMPLLLDGEPVIPSRRITVPLSEPPALAVSGPQMRTVNEDSFLSAQPGSRLRFFSSDTGSATNGGFSKVADCLQSDRRNLRQTGISATVLPSLQGPAVRLEAEAHRACVYTRTSVQQSQPYRVRLQARSVSGDSPRVCIWMEGPNKCAFVDPVSGGHGFNSYSRTFLPEPGTTALRVFVYADATSEKGKTVSVYRNVTIAPLEDLGSWEVWRPERIKEDRQLDAGDHSFEIDLPPSPSVADITRDVSDCDAYDKRSIKEVGISSAPLDEEEQPAIQLQAEAHSACVSPRITPALPGVPYELELDYRSVSGRAPRICVWKEGPNECAEAPALTDDPDWSRFRFTFMPSQATHGLKLFLYADARSGEETTVTEYRGISTRLVAPYEATITRSKSKLRPAPEISWTQTGPSAYAVSIEEADYPFVLGLADSFAEGWRLSGLPNERTSTHLQLDGYSNGWLIDGGGDMTVSIEYGPDRALKMASTASLLVVVLLLIGLIATRGKRLTTTEPANIARQRVATLWGRANALRRKHFRSRDIWRSPPQ